MKRIIMRVILLAAIPIAFVFGVLIGMDVQKSEAEWYRSTALKTADVYGKRIELQGEYVNVLLDINQGVLPVKEGEQKIKEIHERSVEQEKSEKALNDELGKL